jgi:hypothetical protein
MFNEQTGSVITPGTPATVTINTPGQSESLTFAGTAGMYASVQLSNSTFGYCLAASILNPDGTTLTSTNTGGTSLVLTPVALQATGTYTLVLSSCNGYTVSGSATVTVWVFNEQTGFILSGIPATVTINTPGQSDSLNFNGTAGQLASVQLSNSTFGYCLAASIINPDGTTLTSTNTGGTSLVLTPVALQATGTYTLVLSSCSGYTVNGSATVILTLQ